MVIAVLTVLGLCFGSFIGAFVWRFHQQRTKGKKNRKLSIVNGRSMCEACGHELAPADLIPLVSWLSLKGKCRYCKARIGVQAPLLELLTASLFVLSYLAWPYGFATDGMLLFISWLLLLVGLIALAYYDFRWMLLPDRIVYPLTVFWALVRVVMVIMYGSSLMPFIGAAIIFGLFWLIFQVSSGKWIGGGDVKLGLLLGLIAGGVVEAFSVIFLASVIGLVAIVPELLTKRLKPTSRIPFGPFLIAAAIIVFLLGSSLEDFILNYIFLTEA